jgi:hypothetical protein
MLKFYLSRVHIETEIVRALLVIPTEAKSYSDLDLTIAHEVDKLYRKYNPLLCGPRVFCNPVPIIRQ